MKEFYGGIELWLQAERQQMAQPDALTAFLSVKDDMLRAVQFPIEDPRNKGATKAQSHIGQCAKLIDTIESGTLSADDMPKKLGDLASKAFKVASGYSMRAGYFHPSEPESLYRDRMVRLVDASRARIPVLGAEVASLEVLAETLIPQKDTPKSITDIKPLFELGSIAAKVSDNKLQNLLLEELFKDPKFRGSTEAQKTADTLTVVPKALFLALGIGALRIQQGGPKGKGPIILEPKSEANAERYLRIERIQPYIIDGVMSVSSPDMLSRI